MTERPPHELALDDSRLSSQMIRAIDERIAETLRRVLPSEQTGIVSKIDDVRREVSVFLNGAGLASPGWSYIGSPPPIGSRVVVRRSATGERYVAVANLGPALAAVPALFTASSDTTLTATDQEIPGCSITLRPDVAETVLVIGSFNIDPGSGDVYCGLAVDGNAHPTRIVHEGAESNPTQLWLVQLTANVDHILSLIANEPAATGQFVRGVHTTMTVLRWRG